MSGPPTLLLVVVIHVADSLNTWSAMVCIAVIDEACADSWVVGCPCAAYMNMYSICFAMLRKHV